MSRRGKEGGSPAAAACLLFSSFVLGPRAPLNFPALAAADNFSLGTVKTPRARLRGALHPSQHLLQAPPPPASAHRPLLRRPPPANEGQTHPPPRPAPPQSRPSPESELSGAGRRPLPEPRSLSSSALGSAAAVHKLEIVRFSEREGGRNRLRGDGERGGGRRGAGTQGGGCGV